MTKTVIALFFAYFIASRILSEIMAINSELVGFPRFVWMVYPK